VKHTSVVTTGSPSSPGIPCAMVLTVSFVLSPAIGLVCHRHRRRCHRQLDAGVEASGPHDFAVREPALSSAAQAASTASRPASVTIAIRPSVGRDGERFRFDLGQARREIFLQMGLDSQFTDLPVGQISRPVRASRCPLPVLPYCAPHSIAPGPELTARSCSYNDRLPATVRFANMVGEVLTMGSTKGADRQPFKYYI